MQQYKSNQIQAEIQAQNFANNWSFKIVPSVAAINIENDSPSKRIGIEIIEASNATGNELDGPVFQSVKAIPFWIQRTCRVENILTIYTLPLQNYCKLENHIKHHQ